MENQVEVKQRLTPQEAGKIALTLIAQKAESRGINQSPEEFEAKLEALAKKTDIESLHLKRFYANFVVPAALAGYGLDIYLSVKRTWEESSDVWDIALALLREEGVHVSQNEFNYRLDSLSKKTGISKRDLKLFYLQEILPHVIGKIVGWRTCTITIPKSNDPEDIQGQFGG